MHTKWLVFPKTKTASCKKNKKTNLRKQFLEKHPKHNPLESKLRGGYFLQNDPNTESYILSVSGSLVRPLTGPKSFGQKPAQFWQRKSLGYPDYTIGLLGFWCIFLLRSIIHQ